MRCCGSHTMSMATLTTTTMWISIYLLNGGLPFSFFSFFGTLPLFFCHGAYFSRAFFFSCSDVGGGLFILCLLLLGMVLLLLFCYAFASRRSPSHTHALAGTYNNNKKHVDPALGLRQMVYFVFFPLSLSLFFFVIFIDLNVIE